MNIIKEIENEQAQKLAQERPVPDFGPGDTLRVNVKVVEGSRERVQAFEGVCIGRKNAGLNSAFTVRKISYGEGVERVFPLYSTAIDSIEVVRRGDVRRAKLYYLRGLTGKRARITEKTDWASKKAAKTEAATAAEDAKGEEAPAKEVKAEKPKKAKVDIPETGEAEPIDVAPAEGAPAEDKAEAKTKADAGAEKKPAKKAKKKKKADKDEAKD